MPSLPTSSSTGAAGPTARSIGGDDDDSHHESKGDKITSNIVLVIALIPSALIGGALLYCFVFVCVIEPIRKLVLHTIPAAWKRVQQRVRWKVSRAWHAMRERRQKGAEGDVELGSMRTGHGDVGEQHAIWPPVQPHVQRGGDEALPTYEQVIHPGYGLRTSGPGLP